MVVAMLFEHGDGSVERQDGRSKERNRCLVAWAAGLPRTPCFHVRRKLMWEDKHIEAHTHTCIALIDSTGFVVSAVSMARVPMQKK